MKKITVIHLIHTLEIGGAEKLLLSLASALKSDVNIKICSMYGKDDLLPLFHKEKIEVIQINYNNKYNPFIILKLLNIFKQVGADIVHTHLYFATIYGRIAARICKIPTITTEHNISNWERRNILIPLIYKLSLYKKTKIIAISQAVKYALQKKCKINNLEITVLHNFIEEKQVIFDKKDNLPDLNNIVIGSVGRLDYRKGYDILINALALVKITYKNFKCIIVGDGTEKDNLIELRNSKNLEKHVQFAGAQIDIYPYLKLLDIFVSPSRTEGFGLAILEAMAAGCIVVAAKTGGIPEIIKDNDNGLLFKPEDPYDLHKKILIAKNLETDKRERLRSNAISTVSKYCSIDAYIQKLLFEYYNLIAINKTD